jgi:hypothetical protein
MQKYLMASQGDGNEAQIQKTDRDGIERQVNQKTY